MFRIVRRKEPQIHADHAVAALAHDQRGHRAIDAATHRDHHGLARAVTRADFLFRQQCFRVGWEIGGRSRLNDGLELKGHDLAFVLVLVGHGDSAAFRSRQVYAGAGSWELGRL